MDVVKGCRVAVKGREGKGRKYCKAGNPEVPAKDDLRTPRGTNVFDIQGGKKRKKKKKRSKE